MRSTKQLATKGRPRSFDPDKALDRALHVFWEKGYEGASLTDLTKAMGINRPSMYAAFGDKEALFRKVLDRYAEGPAAYVLKAMQEPTGRAAVERLLRDAVDVLTNPKYPKGCLLVQGALACGDESESVRRELVKRRAAGEDLILQRIKSARKDGELPAHINAASLGRFYMTVLRGLGVQAVSGASRAELLAVVDTALAAWPK
jgi:AcrR family transcriptional regulator